MTTPAHKTVASDASLSGRTVVELLAVAAHTAGTPPAAAFAPAQAQPPLPPLWKRRDLWPLFIAVALVFGVLVNDLRMRAQTWYNGQRLAHLEVEFEDKLRLKRLAGRVAAEASRTESELASVTTEVQRLQTLVNGLEHLITRREQMPLLLERIADAVNEELIMRELRLAPKPDSLLYLTVWSLSNTAGQLFVSNLSKNLAALGLEVSSSRILSSRGPSGLNGFEVEVWLHFGAIKQ